MISGTRIKMKYLLLLIIFLPALVLLGLIGKFLMQDKDTLEEMTRAQQQIDVIERLGGLAIALENESTLTALASINPQWISNKELTQQRKTTDLAIDKIRMDSSNGPLIQKALVQLDKLTEKRNLMASQGLSISEIDSYYSNIVDDLQESIATLARSKENEPLSRRLYAFLLLLEEMNASQEERRIIGQALHEGNLDQGNLHTLLQAIGKQSAFEKSFFILADSNEDQLLASISTSPVNAEATRIREEIIAKSSDGKWDIQPTAWLEAKENQINLIQEINHKLLDETRQFISKQVSNARQELILTSSLIAAIALATLVFTVISMRYLAKKLQSEVEGLASASHEILSSISEASSGTSETAAAVTETTSTVEELKQTAQLAAEKAKNVSEVSNQTMHILQKGEKSLDTTLEDMKRIQEGMGTISESIITLSEQSQTIGKIIDSVNDLAEQSHLLAVNAAIEAAKAGDQGRGFAVVADEVRSLAEQSKQATQQVRGILSDIQNATSAAVMATEKGSKAVSQGMIQSQQTNESIKSASSQMNTVVQAASQIAISSQQQLIGVGQVTIAMTNIKEASNQHVDNMRQIETGVQGLNNVGQNLQKLVSEYKL